jgi:hypothetical protein
MAITSGQWHVLAKNAGAALAYFKPRFLKRLQKGFGKGVLEIVAHNLF